jgi:CRP-like cAMP-binding protein
MIPGEITDSTELAGLRALGRRRSYRFAEVVFHEGERSEFVIIIDRGTVKISTVSVDGYETVLAVRSSGEVVGELAALDGRPRSATVTALNDVHVVLVQGEQFRAYLLAHPVAGLAMLRRLVDRLRDADRRRAEFGAYDVTARVARLLLDLADRSEQPGAPTNQLVAAPLSQAELAGAAGASREAVAKVLRRLRSDGLVATYRRSITILRPDALETLARRMLDQPASTADTPSQIRKANRQKPLQMRPVLR